MVADGDAATEVLPLAAADEVVTSAEELAADDDADCDAPGLGDVTPPVATVPEWAAEVGSCRSRPVFVGGWQALTMTAVLMAIPMIRVDRLTLIYFLRKGSA